jgi:hypothetical protein
MLGAIWRVIIEKEKSLQNGNWLIAAYLLAASEIKATIFVKSLES